MKAYVAILSFSIAACLVSGCASTQSSDPRAHSPEVVEQVRRGVFEHKRFEPDFPIIPLYATENETRNLLSQHSAISEEDPRGDRDIAQKILMADKNGTRIAVGIWDGRVRFTNYLTERFNRNDELKGRKLNWFVDYYGGSGEFGEPVDTGYMIFLRNPTKKITIVFALHMGAVRVIDEDPEHWPDTND